MPRMKRMAARARSKVRQAPGPVASRSPSCSEKVLSWAKTVTVLPRHSAARYRTRSREDGFFFCGMMVEVPQYWSARSIMPNS